MDSRQTFKLNGGGSMPAIGLGTLQLQGPLVKDILDFALSIGYLMIDTAPSYDNEHTIGAALRDLLPKHKLKRENIFITSKLPPSHLGSKAPASLQASLDKLGCGYLDLFLIHWPGEKGVPPNSESNRGKRAETWRLLVEAKNAGLVRNIGVSNYAAKHIEELAANNYGVPPTVNQVECHPCHPQLELRSVCRKHGVLLQAYFSLGGERNHKALLGQRSVLTIAQKLNKEPAQILLRWATQQNIAVIPCSTSREHLKANVDLKFDIPEDDMHALQKLTLRRFGGDPNIVA